MPLGLAHEPEFSWLVLVAYLWIVKTLAFSRRV